MKTQKVTINVFEPGDRVITPDGYGTVISDNIHTLKDEDIYNKNFYHEVIVQHDEGISAKVMQLPSTPAVYSNSQAFPVEMPFLLKPGDEGFEKPKTGYSRI